MTDRELAWLFFSLLVATLLVVTTAWGQYYPGDLVNHNYVESQSQPCIQGDPHSAKNCLSLPELPGPFQIKPPKMNCPKGQLPTIEEYEPTPGVINVDPTLMNAAIWKCEPIIGGPAK